MLSNIRNRKEKGFTIIEVLIVLAIAGLILLVVFLAVPALQRNARNTQRSNDIAGLLGGMSEYVNNNSGSLPNTQGAGSGTTYTIGAGTTGDNDVEVTMGFFGGDEVTILDVGAGVAGNDNEDQARIVLGAACGGTSGTDAVAGSSRGYVALYTLENNSRQCRSS
ncbi:MAG: type II secretion system protein [Candidatus Saccharimonadales bacterium]